MPLARPTDDRAALAVRVGVALLAAAVAFGFWGYSYDDNYVTYRYAKNWLAGDGLVYNPGERVFGTSAPGYALLLGGLAALGRPFGVDVHHWATVVSALSWLAVAWVFQAWISRAAALGRGGGRWLPVAGFAAVALPLRWNLQLLGSEAFPVMALAVASAYALFAARRPALAGLLIAGAMFLRLDAGLAALAIGLVEWWRGKRFPAAYAVAGILPLAAWLLFLQSYYGQVVPMTFRGKKALAEVPYTLRQWQTLTLTLPKASAVWLLGGALAGLAALARSQLWRRPAALALGSWLAAHELAYRALRVWFAPWYHVYLVHAVVAFFVLGSWTLARTAAARLRAAPDAGRRAAEAALLALLLAPVVAPSLGYAAESWRRPTDPRYRVYAATGRFIRDRLPPRPEVLALEIGVLGYLCECRILDYGALVSPRFTAAKFTGRRPQLVAELEPEYVVAIEHNTMLAAAVERLELRRRYDVVAIFRDSDFGQGEVRLLKRGAAAAPAPP